MVGLGEIGPDPTGDAIGTTGFRTDLDLDLSLRVPVTG